jgi:hypothetical protein
MMHEVKVFPFHRAEVTVGGYRYQFWALSQLPLNCLREAFAPVFFLFVDYFAIVIAIGVKKRRLP